jgi:hypothetical protein
VISTRYGFEEIGEQISNIQSPMTNLIRMLPTAMPFVHGHASKSLNKRADWLVQIANSLHNPLVLDVLGLSNPLL